MALKTIFFLADFADYADFSSLNLETFEWMKKPPDLQPGAITELARQPFATGKLMALKTIFFLADFADYADFSSLNLETFEWMKKPPDLQPGAITELARQTFATGKLMALKTIFFLADFEDYADFSSLNLETFEWMKKPPDL